MPEKVIARDFYTLVPEGLTLIYSVFDKVSKTYGPVRSSPNLPTAKRQIRLSLLQDNTLRLSCKDYFLFTLGIFDERSGELFIDANSQETIPFEDILSESDGDSHA